MTTGTERSSVLGGRREEKAHFERVAVEHSMSVRQPLGMTDHRQVRQQQMIGHSEMSYGQWHDTCECARQLNPSLAKKSQKRIIKYEEKTDVRLDRWTYFSWVELLNCIPQIVENSLSKRLQSSDIRLSIMHASPSAREARHRITNQQTYDT